ncbi:MAG: DUF2219 family protein [Planctomycetes bacterium]|nr:DUF2219 family protein [Planctomycetota bacterium]
MRMFVCFFLACLMMGPVAFAQDDPFNVSVYIENDGSFLKPNHSTDRHYTNGFRLTAAHHPDWANDLADAMEPVFSLGPVADRKTAFGYSFGQNMYTPDEITIATLIPGDRPYACWLYVGGYLQRQVDNVFDHLELNLGVLGPAAQGEGTQKFVHRLVGADEPKGWDNQIGNEFAFDLVYRRKWKVALSPAEQVFRAELIPTVGGAAGLLRVQAEGGATFRVGWQLPDDFGPGRLDDPASATRIAYNHDKPGFYGFVRLGGRLVAHDATFEGGNFGHDHGVDLQHAVGEAQFGLVFLYRWFEMSYAQTYLTEQFKGQHGGDSYGALVFTFKCDF